MEQTSLQLMDSVAPEPHLPEAGDNVGIPIELALASVDQRLRDEGIRNNVSLVVGGSIRNALMW